MLPPLPHGCIVHASYCQWAIHTVEDFHLKQSWQNREKLQYKDLHGSTVCLYPQEQEAENSTV